MRWFIVKTARGDEHEVKRSLQTRIEDSSVAESFDEILVPERPSQHSERKRRKFLDGFVFVRMKLTREAWHLVKSTAKVEGFLSSGLNPKPVSLDEMRGLLQRIEAEERELAADRDPAAAPTLVLGQTVRVKRGAYANFVGTIEAVDAQLRQLTLVLTSFGQKTRVTLGFEQVEPCA